MESAALASLLEAKIKLKMDEIAKIERQLAVTRISLGNDIKTLEQIIIYAKDYGNYEI